MLNEQTLRAPVPRSMKGILPEQLYAVRVQGALMCPAHKDGEVLLIGPSHAVVPGDSVIVKLQGERGAGYVRTVKALSSESVVLQQFQPYAEVEVLLSDVEALHHVMEPAELFCIRREENQGPSA